MVAQQSFPECRWLTLCIRSECLNESLFGWRRKLMFKNVNPQVFFTIFDAPTIWYPTFQERLSGLLCALASC